MDTVLLVAKAGISFPFFPVRYKPSMVLRSWSKLTVSEALDMSMVDISAPVDQEKLSFFAVLADLLPQPPSRITDKAPMAPTANFE